MLCLLVFLVEGKRDKCWTPGFVPPESQCLVGPSGPTLLPFLPPAVPLDCQIYTLLDKIMHQGLISKLPQMAKPGRQIEVPE